MSMEIPTLAMIIPSMIIEIDVSSHPLWLIIRIDQKMYKLDLNGMYM